MSAEIWLNEGSTRMPEKEAIIKLQAHINGKIVGQTHLVQSMIIAILADGHILVEGAPGLAKTLAIKELSLGVEGAFHRIQFTPDLLPGDVTGTEIYRPQDSEFAFQQGPIFHNLILADEINRAPAKVQSALLEAMAERQVTVGRNTYSLPELFLVMATQNPIEQEGTYPLPEAQLDRFLLYIRIDYPDIESEQLILKLARERALSSLSESSSDSDDFEPISQKLIFQARRKVLELHISAALEEYIVQLVVATRDPRRYGDDLKSWVSFGASPRATIALDRCAKAHAWLNGRDYVSPDDIHAVAHDILRHRIIMSFEAEADAVSSDQFISELLQRVPVP